MPRWARSAPATPTSPPTTPDYARLRPRLGHSKALVAVGHSILVAAFHMLDRDQPYHDLGPDYFIRHNNPERRARKLIRQLEAIGYTVTAQPPAA